jgi:hypothetical protein
MSNPLLFAQHSRRIKAWRKPTRSNQHSGRGHERRRVACLDLTGVLTV